MKYKLNGYYWTVIDILSAFAVLAFLISIAYEVFSDVGLSLTSIAGTIWGTGTLGFLMLYQLPIFGNSYQTQELLDKGKKHFTQEEVKIIMEDRRHTKIPKETLIKFIIFFITSGVITLAGIIANT